MSGPYDVLMSASVWLSIATRIATFCLMLSLAIAARHARSGASGVMRETADFFAALAWMLGWFTTASLLRLGGVMEPAQATLSALAWLAWSPLLVSLIRLHAAIGRERTP